MDQRYIPEFKIKNLRTYILSAILSVAIIRVEAQENDSTEIMQATLKFVDAFNSLDWKVFSQSFTEDATIFFPEWEQARRRSGRLAIDKSWLEIFPEFNDTASTLELNIVPEDLQVQRYGRTAIITFHMGDDKSFLARRTIVMVRRNRHWRIAHLHASMLSPTNR